MLPNPLLVRSSQADALAGRIPPESSSASLRRNRQPGGLDIDRRVLITVMGSPTLGAYQIANGKQHLSLDAPTPGASLRRWKEAVDSDDRLPVHCGLLLQLPNTTAYGGIRKCAGKAVVLDHATQAGEDMHSRHRSGRPLGLC
jgi:hypothetical protein